MGDGLTWPIYIVLVVLSPDSPLGFRIAGSPATFIDSTLKDPEDAAARRPRLAGAAKQRVLAVSKESEILIISGQREPGGENERR